MVLKINSSLKKLFNASQNSNIQGLIHVENELCQETRVKIDAGQNVEALFFILRVSWLENHYLSISPTLHAGCVANSSDTNHFLFDQSFVTLP